jgi:SAM-dependent methyltransferase
MPISYDDVCNAYRFILGRAPESEEIIKLHLNHNYASVEDLRQAFLSSNEFRDLGILASEKLCAALRPPQDIETETDAATLKAIVAKTAAYWSEIGKKAPHWSVITSDQFKPSNLVENEGSFFESGAGDRDLILALLRRIGRSAPEFRRCVEYGCGVGRVTAHLAAAFDEVMALDISPSHLELARKHCAASGISNVQCLQVTPDDLMPAVNYDLWFSRLVLQHNAPPVTMAILDKAFAGLQRNGVAIIHIPTYREGYSFKIRDYLAGSPGRDMEMHVTPQNAILELGARRNCCVREVHEEPGHGITITNIFVFQKT